MVISVPALLIVTISTNEGSAPAVPLRNGAMTVSPDRTNSGPMATVLEVSPVSATGPVASTVPV